MLALALSVAAFAASEAGECAAPTAPSGLDAALTSAEAAWGVDEAAFSRGVESARATLRCLGAPLDRAQAARVHRVEGLAAFLTKDTAAATRAFAASAVLDPTYTFPTAMVPNGNPVRVLYEGAVATGAERSVPPPVAGTTLRVDGAEARVLPASRPAVVQVLVGERVTGSAWVPPGGTLPEYRARGEGLRLPLLLGAVGLAAGAGIVGYFAAVAHDGVLQPAPSAADVWSRQADANALGATTWGLGAAAVTTGAGAFLFARW